MNRKRFLVVIMAGALLTQSLTTCVSAATGDYTVTDLSVGKPEISSEYTNITSETESVPESDCTNDEINTENPLDTESKENQDIIVDDYSMDQILSNDQILNEYDCEEYGSTEYSWEKTVFERLEITLSNYEESFDVSDLNITYSDEMKDMLYILVEKYLTEHSQYFYATLKGVGYCLGLPDSYITDIHLIYAKEFLDSSNKPDLKKINENLAKYNAGVKNAMSYIDDSMSDMEKALAIHDWIVLNCDYDVENYIKDTIPKSSTCAYGVFVNGIAVCSGYASAFNTLAKLAGLESESVLSTPMDHQWNLVKIDGQWYHVDTCWDDPVTGAKLNDQEGLRLGCGNYVVEGLVFHDNFLCTDKEMTETKHHDWSTVNLSKVATNDIYKDYIFHKNNDSTFQYSNGKWYCQVDNVIYQCDLDKSTTTVVYTGEEPILGFIMIKDDMYIMTHSNLIKKNRKDDTLSKELIKGSSFGDYNLGEMCIKQGILTVNMYRDYYGTLTYLSKKIDIHQDLDYAISINTLPSKTSYLLGSKTLNTNGLTLMATYQDGYNTAITSGFSCGTFNGNKLGTQNVLVTYKNKTTSFSVDVKEEARDISFDQIYKVMNIGDIIKLKVNYFPAGSYTDIPLTWKSDNTQLAEVNQNGEVKALKRGTVMITATYGTKKITCTITIKSPLRIFNIDSKATLNGIGDISCLFIIYIPSDSTDDLTTTWTSSNTSVVKVNDGYITSTGVGKATVTAKCGHFTAACEVTVNPVAMSGISLNATSATLNMGDSKSLSVSYQPSNTTDDKTVTWSSSDSTIAEVDQEGNVTAKLPGVATITAKCGKFTKTATITVAGIPLQSININKAPSNMILGDECKLAVKYYPDIAMVSKLIKWTSSNTSVLTVDENGNIKAVGVGSATITAECGKVKNSVLIRVDRIEMTGIKVNKTTLSLLKGKSEQLLVTYEPENTTDKKDITWSSSNSNVATVDSKGNVTAKADGKTTITGKCNSYTVKCEVTVTDPDAEKNSINNVEKHFTGWHHVNNKDYWFEDGVRQGFKENDKLYRGKEIYDPGTNAWYWLDNVQNGAKAVSKDVYQESSGGKWVRYDENGHMVKGFNKTDKGTYYFDLVTGAMIKGNVVIDNNLCHFDETTGIGTEGWVSEDGKDYWYEGGVRQGYHINDEAYRGKEIYDPDSRAWNWLDNVQKGAKAVSKDVYQDSSGGKWVRYNAKGQMIKGFDNYDNGVYYFDLITGAMYKGNHGINGILYQFDAITGKLK